MTPGKDKSKPVRWGYFVRAAIAGQVLLPEHAPWAEDLLSWWLAGLRAAHDDDADAASQLAVWLETAPAPGVHPLDAFAFLDSMG
jgi:predicted phage terminase large subunit-like protein